MAMPAREVAVEIVRVLRAQGFVAVLAGGCVRDELLGLAPKDYDVATDAGPERVERLFPGTREVGKVFGVVPVVRKVRGERVVVEVATFREEAGYSDKRRPDSVRFSDAKNDALRRDFTINALFIDPLDESDRAGGKVIDYVGGLADLSAKVIRAVGDADARLAEDHLRALRAVRFAARLGFAIDAATAAAITRHARELAGVSRERIGDEVRRMMAHPARATAVRLINDLGLDGSVLDERVGAHGTVTLEGVAAGAGVVTGMAAWAVDRLGRPSGEVLLKEAEAVATRWRRALCLSNEERTGLAAVVSGVGAIETGWETAGVARRKRMAGSGWFEAAMQIIATRNSKVARGVRDEVARLAGLHGGISPSPLVTGDDLVAAGLVPGPSFGGWLERVYDAQLEGRVVDRDGALALVMGWARGG